MLRLIIKKKKTMLEGCLFLWIVNKGRLGVQEAEVHLGCCFLSIIHLLFVLRQGLTLLSSMWRPKVDIRGLPQLRLLHVIFWDRISHLNPELAFCLLCESPSCALNYSGLPYLPVIQVYSLFHSGQHVFYPWSHLPSCPSSFWSRVSHWLGAHH